MDRDRPAQPYAPGKWILAALFIAGGLNHFRMTGFYVRIMPLYLPRPAELVWISGVFEVLGGVGLLIPATRRASAWGLIALLMAVFPANIYVFQHRAEFPLPFLVHLLRLPLQGALIWWAHRYTRRGPWPIGARPTTLATGGIPADHPG